MAYNDYSELYTKALLEKGIKLHFKSDFAS